MTEEKSISLFYRQGTSDKVYRVYLKKRNSGYTVGIEYGRRGSTLTCLSKTPKPVDLNKANELFDNLVHSKKLKGYTEAEGQVPYVGTDKEEKISGVLPQLLNNIPEEDLDAYLNSFEFCLQEKKDGKRILLSKTGNTISAINRKGLYVGFPKQIEFELSNNLIPDFILDGEMIGEVFWLFDVLKWETEDMKKLPYTERYEWLIEKVAESDAIKIVPAYFTPRIKRDAFNELKSRGAEGVVFKRVGSLYLAGRPASKGDQLKYKFTETATCQVSGTNEKGKRSVYIQVLDGKKLTDVGKVSIPPNFEVPEIGDLVEVRYLYRHVLGALYQPVYLGIRDDKEKPDQVKTLKVKEGVDYGEEDET